MAGFDRIERLSFPALLDAAVDEDKGNHMRGRIHGLGICFRSRLHGQNKKERSDELGALHFILRSQPPVGSLGSGGRMG